MKSRLSALANPLLSREIRARFRDGRAFILLFVMVGGLSLFFAYLYSDVTTASDFDLRASHSGQKIFEQLSWMQTLAWLLISPALTSSSIAYERERGWFDSLLLSPLHPRAIVLGKWGAALLYAAILTLVTLPLVSLIFLLGGVSTAQMLEVALLQAGCAACGGAIGIACSSWSPRANTALRTANGLILIGLSSSLFGAAMVGEVPFPMFVGTSTNPFWTWLGRTNPILRCLEVTGNDPASHLAFCLAFLGAATLGFLFLASHYARRPLQEAPFVQKRAKKSARTALEPDIFAAPETAPRSRAKSATHGEIPFVTKLRFANPVLDREVRSKFRMRQPPLGVIIAEAILGVLVTIFYGRTLWMALFEPNYRDLIWWGLSFTGLIVTMMAAALMGSNGVSREREGGTWEGVCLSLLSPSEIVRGKVVASILTCVLFSIPVWPLLLPCVEWDAAPGSGALITRADVASCLLIWLSTAWSYTLIGLWIGRRAARTSRASGQTLGLLTAFLLVSPWLLLQDGAAFGETILGLTHPLIELANATTRSRVDVHPVLYFAIFQGVVGLCLWGAMVRSLSRDIRSAGEAAKRP